MQIALPQYNGRDNQVMLAIVPVGAIILNIVMLGGQYFSGVPYFLLMTLATSVPLGLFFMTCGLVAVVLKNRFPKERQLLKRLAFMIFTFITMSGLFLLCLFSAFKSIPFFQFQASDRAFAWSYFALAMVNIFITFLMEGISIFREWEANWQETEKLNRAIKKSQLDGLKSQVNPHFLFNSLNSLSSLIQEDEEKAEKFLDEMSKVYRYMLRDDAQLVPLATELKFVESYKHLLCVRFAEGLNIETKISGEALAKGIAPLALQVLIENAFSQNVVSKSQPLRISIFTNESGELVVKNKLQPKKTGDSSDLEASLDNLVSKYRLLKNPVRVEDSGEGFRTITVPLLNIEQ